MTIDIDTFASVDMRVGTIVVAERVPDADKLIRIEVDIGEESPRQIVAGIAPYYSVEDLQGRRIIVVANLQPRKLRGLESNGMLLAASAENDRPVLVTVTEDVPNGARLK
jgi:methionyl-tRNA synthetase